MGEVVTGQKIELSIGLKVRRILLRLIWEGGAIIIALSSLQDLTSYPIIGIVILFWLMTVSIDAFLMGLPDRAIIWEARGALFYFVFFLLLLFSSVYEYTHLEEIIPRNITISTIGIILMFIALTIRWISIRTLGRYFVAEVMIQDNHKLITSGIYKYIRHPGYLGITIFMFGFCLSLSSVIGLLILTWLGIPVLLNRISHEEILLIKEFGEEYLIYKNQTNKLIPFIY